MNRLSKNANNMRRSSLMMNPMKMSKDPRPLKDKKWIEQQILKLIEYLCCHGYESSMLSPKDLNPPSTKNFQYICCFLFQQIDPSFNILPTNKNNKNKNNNNNKKFEDECISFFEKLGYPFKISKSSIRCIAPHAWPPLLGSISWIIELLMFAESFDQNVEKGIQNVENEDQDSDVKMTDVENKNNKNKTVKEINVNEENEKSDALFFNLVADNYGLWLAGDDDDDTITQRLMNAFTQKIQCLNEDIQTFKKANDQLITEKERIIKESPKISDLQDQRQNTIMALNEINKIIKQRDEYISALKSKYNEWDNKVNEKIVKINISENQISELKETLSKQTISTKEVEIMNKESMQLNMETDELQLKKEEIKRKQYDLNEGINDLIKKIKNLIRQYNDLGSKIEIIPQTAKYSCGQNHTLKYNHNSNINNNHNHNMNINKATDLVNQDIEYFGNNLVQLKNHYNDKLRKCQLRIKTESDKISQFKTDLKLKKEEILILNERLSNITNLYNGEKSKMSLLSANTAKNIEKIELSISSQSNDIDNELKNKTKEFVEIKNEYTKTYEICKKIEIQLTSKIAIGVQKLLKHRQNIREQLKMLHKKVDNALEKVTFYHIQEPTIHNISANNNYSDDDDDDNKDDYNDVDMENN